MCIQHTCDNIEEVNVDSFVVHMIFNPFLQANTQHFQSCLIK